MCVGVYTMTGLLPLIKTAAKCSYMQNHLIRITESEGMCLLMNTIKMNFNALGKYNKAARNNVLGKWCGGHTLKVYFFPPVFEAIFI